MKKFDFVVGQKVLILPEFGKDGEYPDTLEIGKIATVTNVVNSMSGEITLPDGSVYLAFSDEIEAVEQSVERTPSEIGGAKPEFVVFDEISDAGE